MRFRIPSCRLRRLPVNIIDRVSISSSFFAREPPLTIHNPFFLIRKMIEEAAREVKRSIRTLGTKVHDNRVCCLPAISNVDGPETVRSRVSSAKLMCVQSDDIVRSLVVLSARSEANIVKREATVKRSSGEVGHPCSAEGDFGRGGGEWRGNDTAWRYTHYVRYKYLWLTRNDRTTDSVPGPET